MTSPPATRAQSGRDEHRNQRSTRDPRNGAAPSLDQVVKAYVALTKPRIIELLLVTTIPAMFLAAGGTPPVWRAIFTMLGGLLAAASANSFNSVLEADRDAHMRRTRRRPMPLHKITPAKGYVFAGVLAVLASLVLGFGANWLSAGLALAANAVYVFVYTLWLKPRTSQNIVWGGIAGCFPPLIGWTAITGSIGWAPIVMFLIVFFWTPPHTWALAFRYREDYEAGGVPMLPVVMAAPGVCLRILLYTIATVVTSMLLWPVAHTGWIYPSVAAIGGVVFIVEAVQLWRRAKSGLTDHHLNPMRLFHLSNSYLAILFVAAAIDPLIL